MNSWWGCRTPLTKPPSSICIPWHGQPVETVVCVKLHCDCSTLSCWHVLFSCSWKIRGEIWFSSQNEYSSTVSDKISNPPVSQWCKIWMKFEDAIVHFIIGLLYIQYILRVALSFISHHVVKQLCLELDLQMFEILPLLYVVFYHKCSIYEENHGNAFSKSLQCWSTLNSFQSRHIFLCVLMSQYVNFSCGWLFKL